MNALILKILNCLKDLTHLEMPLMTFQFKELKYHFQQNILKILFRAANI